MSTMLEQLRAKRQEMKSKETKLFPQKSYAGILAINKLPEGKTTFRVVKHEEDTLAFVGMRTTYLEVDENIQNLSRFNLEKVIKERKMEKTLGIKKVEDLSDVSDDDLRQSMIDELGNDFSFVILKSIFISTVHGNPEMPDITEEYIKIAQKQINDVVQDPEEKKKKIGAIMGYRDAKKEWHPGITPSTNWVCYAYPLDMQDNELKRLTMYPKHMDEVEKLYAAFDSAEEPLTVDPFSDPVEGIPIIFEKTMEQGKAKFIISEKKAPRTMNAKDFAAKFALTPEQLSEIASKPSLTSMHVNVYGKRDFELALNGLQLFDEKNEIGVFENDEFMEVASKLADYYDQETPKEEVKNDDKEDDLKILDKKPGKVVEQEKKANTPKNLTNKVTNREKLVKELKELDPNIRILPRHTEDDLSDMIEELKAEANAQPDDPDENQGDSNLGEIQTDDQPKVTTEVKKDSIKPTNTSDAMASLRDRLKKKQG